MTTNQLKALEDKRDHAMRELWMAYNNISEEIGIDAMKDEDTRMWAFMTRHLPHVIMASIIT